MMKHVIALGIVACLTLLAVVLIGCSGRFMSPGEAYSIETERCSRSGDAEDIRRCQSMIDKKYGRYNREGGYPNDPRSGQCYGDCR